MGAVSIHAGLLTLPLRGLKMLTDKHKELLRITVKGRAADSKIESEKRLAIRQICAELMPSAEPERLLRAFADALVHVADAERIPSGVERDAMLSQIVSIFVDELHACADDADLELGLRRETPASAPRLILDNDSANTPL
jgi:hypothetical protein